MTTRRINNPKTHTATNTIKFGDIKQFPDKILGKLKYKCIASRSTKERAEELKKRLTRIGTISVKIQKVQEKVVGLPPVYYIFARPSKQPHLGAP